MLKRPTYEALVTQIQIKDNDLVKDMKKQLSRAECSLRQALEVHKTENSGLE